MKKRSSSRQNPKPVKAKRAKQSVTIGMDLGDKNSRYCVLSEEGEILRQGQVATTKAGMIEAFAPWDGPESRLKSEPILLG